MIEPSTEGSIPMRWPLLLTAGVAVLTFAGILPAADKNPAAAPPAPAAQVQTSEKTFDFEDTEVGKAPAGFTAAISGQGPNGSWLIQEDAQGVAGKRVLVQASTDRTDNRFPLYIYDQLAAKDVEVSVHLKPVAGNVDQAGGIVVRYQDKDNYYVARANALENNVRLYKMVNGKRIQFAGTDTKVTPGQWHSLKLSAKGTHFQVSLDGQPLFEADDNTFKNAGKVGLWTKADSVTCFDSLKIESSTHDDNLFPSPNPCSSTASVDAAGRAVVFCLAATSIWCLLADFYGLLSMRAFTLCIFLPTLAVLAALAWSDQQRGDRRLWQAIVIGTVAGFVAAVAYDLFRLPFVFARVGDQDRSAADAAVQGLPAFRGHDPGPAAGAAGLFLGRPPDRLGLPLQQRHHLRHHVPGPAWRSPPPFLALGGALRRGAGTGHAADAVHQCLWHSLDYAICDGHRGRPSGIRRSAGAGGQKAQQVTHRISGRRVPCCEPCPPIASPALWN